MSWVIETYVKESARKVEEIRKVGERILRYLFGRSDPDESESFRIGYKFCKLLSKDISVILPLGPSELVNRYGVKIKEDKDFFLIFPNREINLDEVKKYLKKKGWPFKSFQEYVIIPPNNKLYECYVIFSKNGLALAKGIWSSSRYGIDKDKAVSRKIIEMFDNVASKFYKIPKKK